MESRGSLFAIYYGNDDKYKNRHKKRGEAKGKSKSKISMTKKERGGCYIAIDVPNVLNKEWEILNPKHRGLCPGNPASPVGAYLEFRA